MIFSIQEQLIDDSSTSIRPSSVQNVSNYSYFGVTVDKNLTFRTQLNNLLSKLTKSAGLLYRLKNSSPHYIRLTFN